MQSAVALVMTLLLVAALWVQGVYTMEGRTSPTGLITTGFLVAAALHALLVRWPKVRRFIRANQARAVVLPDPPG